MCILQGPQRVSRGYYVNTYSLMSNVMQRILHCQKCPKYAFRGCAPGPSRTKRAGSTDNPYFEP